jgi:hypothetical protein
MWFRGETYACTKHCPKARVPTKTSLTKSKTEDLAKQARDLGLDIPSRKVDLVKVLHDHLRSIGWTKFTGGASIKHAPVLDLSSDIAHSLDHRAGWWNGADYVVIENQKDRRMFAVQAMIHMYFAIKKFKVKGVSAVHKLNNILTLDGTSTYKARKKTGIIHCEKLMPAANAAFFKSHKKKDDLADSFLQGLWFLEDRRSQHSERRNHRKLLEASRVLRGEWIREPHLLLRSALKASCARIFGSDPE